MFGTKKPFSAPAKGRTDKGFRDSEPVHAIAGFGKIFLKGIRRSLSMCGRQGPNALRRAEPEYRNRTAGKWSDFLALQAQRGQVRHGPESGLWFRRRSVTRRGQPCFRDFSRVSGRQN